MRVFKATALAVLTVAGIVIPGAAASHTMSGSVGPGFTISLTGTAGLVPGETHTIVISDQGTEHNFHLLGTSVVTDIEGTGTSTFQVTLPAGQYTYLCDPHSSTMRGTFTVGAAAPPPPASKAVRLTGSVGPGAKIDLRRGAKRVTSLAAGRYLFVVSDRSALDNFHLTGPGVSRKTGVAAKGTVRWTLRLKSGAHMYRSDAHTKLRRGFVVKAVG